MILSCLNNVRKQVSCSTNTNELFTYVGELLTFSKKNYKIISVKAQVECKLGNISAVEAFVKDHINVNNETLWKLTPTTPSQKLHTELSYTPLSSQNISENVSVRNFSRPKFFQSSYRENENNAYFALTIWKFFTTKSIFFLLLFFFI